MSIEQNLISLVNELKVFFNSRLSYFETFTKHGVQVEGWFKGELLNFLENKNPVGIIGFEREYSIGIGRRKVDFVLETEGNGLPRRVLVEIKHWLIGFQKGIRWSANSYFGDTSSVGIEPDVEKLSKLKEDGMFVLIFATSNPGENDWESGIRKFNSKFAPLKVKALTSPIDYPPTFFLGLLKLG